MPSPLIRKVGSGLVVAGPVLALLAVEGPLAGANWPWPRALARLAALLLIIATFAQAMIPKRATVWLGAITAVAVASYGLVGRRQRFEAFAWFGVALAVPLILLLAARLSSDRRSVAVLASIAVLSAVELARAAVYEPFADVNCVGLCYHNPILVTPDLVLANRLGIVATVGTAGVAATIIRRLIEWVRSRGRMGGNEATAVLAAAGTGLVLGVDSATRLVTGTIAAPGEVNVSTLVVLLAASTCAATSLVCTALGPLLARRDVGRVAGLLTRADAASDVQAVFRNGFGDPNLRVGYWADDGLGFLDRNGETLDDASPGSRIELTSRGSPIALIISKRESISSDLLSKQLGQQAVLAIHNERLTCELNRRAAEVTRSRRRIVEVGDAERLRLERDLHDGAQQRLLALSFELRRGQRAALNAGDPTTAATFGSAYEATQAAFEGLRQLAQGIHPTVLTGNVLHDLLREFASSISCPSTFDIHLAEAIPAPVASNIYEVVTAALVDTSSGERPAITVRQQDHQISIVIDHISTFPQHALDRADAVGGCCVQTGRGFEVSLPCA